MHGPFFPRARAALVYGRFLCHRDRRGRPDRSRLLTNAICGAGCERKEKWHASHPLGVLAVALQMGRRDRQRDGTLIGFARMQIEGATGDVLPRASCKGGHIRIPVLTDGASMASRGHAPEAPVERTHQTRDGASKHASRAASPGEGGSCDPWGVAVLSDSGEWPSTGLGGGKTSWGGSRYSNQRGTAVAAKFRRCRAPWGHCQ